MNPYLASAPNRPDPAELAHWNAEVQRAMDEYALHPTTVCAWPGCHNLVDGRRFCDDPTEHDESVCRICLDKPREKHKKTCWTCRHGGREAAAERMRLRRRGGAA